MILVVDDDHAVVQLCRTILEEEGYDVRTAGSVQEAYKHLRNPKCKGMLLDLLMPKLNGAALLMLMPSEGIKTPVIVMSGGADYDESELKQFSNVRKMLRKPFYAEDLLGAVRQHFPREQK